MLNIKMYYNEFTFIKQTVAFWIMKPKLIQNNIEITKICRFRELKKHYILITNILVFPL